MRRESSAIALALTALLACRPSAPAAKRGERGAADGDRDRDPEVERGLILPDRGT